jgi:hypothetical protein
VTVPEPDPANGGHSNDAINSDPFRTCKRSALLY